MTRILRAESTIVAEIRLALGSETDLVLWRNHVGQLPDPLDPARRHRFGLAVGSADLVGILKVHGFGRFFALEVKARRGRTSPEQDRWLSLVVGYGGFASVVHSVDEARGALERARKGHLA